MLHPPGVLQPVSLLRLHGPGVAVPGAAGILLLLPPPALGVTPAGLPPLLLLRGVLNAALPVAVLSILVLGIGRLPGDM